ncbi:dihydroorotase [Magnetospirillum gryphiswaldense]|uniref:Dihydroorotase n=1 Tax=Magnetospirillum gryphiswaldense TaxID=55518 RepID=A4TWR9_9PROT|nr:dihydroorotase [Magnetospirillum gryphiswaldense]AVM74397.1 Dihydroorotase [Magnetospirillum gryphiswaldense MSR-1]AVM78300.1 Dihydroorotase [Magnetospirillum gryphiswaldense]CAM75076.1 Dihydroorotase multifunctional complex type [Magnetospirillum gryphiswaldense MSR-1]
MSKPVTSGLVAYVNARLLDPATGLDAKGALLIQGETIADVGPGLFQGGVPSGIEVVDCQGLCLAPGLVDMRVQVREPGEEHKETLKSAGEAAVAGGVTSMVCLPNTDPIMDEVATVEFVARRARKNGLAKIYPYAAATKKLEGKELSEMGFLKEAGALAFTDGIKAIADAQTMRRALSYAATFDALIVQHPEDPSLAGSGVMNAGERATRMGLSGIPVEAEIIMLERDMRLVAMTGGRYHAAHVSTAEGIDVIRRAKAKGLPVTCDTAPPYFALNELEVHNYRTFAKLSPPLRSEADRQAVIAGLADGTIDAIASDHAPQDEDAKRQTFAAAEFGGIGLETLLAATIGLVQTGALALLPALGLLTCGPADILALPAGRLKMGAAADLVLFDPDRGWQVDPVKFKSKSKNSPFDGRPMQGVVLRTVVDGRTVHRV